MLEHGTDAAGTDSPPPSPKEEEYYTPQEGAGALTGKDKAPTPKRFNRRMLAGIGALGALIAIAAFWVGLKVPQAKAPEAVATPSRPPVPNESVNALPAGYDAMVPQLGDPRPGDVAGINGDTGLSVQDPNSNSPVRQLTALEQYTEQAEIDRRRNEDRARTAGVSFANGGATEASMPSPVAAGATDASQLQERILDLAERHGAPATAPPNASLIARDDANRQDDKAEFAGKSRDTDFALHARLERPQSPYTLFAGTILPCVLTQGINSDLPGDIQCMISQNVFDTVSGRHLLIPQGTKAIGLYDSRIAYGQERVLVVWTRLLRPDGSTLSLEGMPGTDLSGYAGLTGHVNNHYLRLVSGVVLGSLIGAGAQIATGANSQNPSFAALAVQGAGQNINEAGQQITRKNLNIQPTIEVRPGSRLNIFATKDLILPPWKD